jgi:phosphatidylserine/phosphatidylglycerophosphate/cardiolipin synthase-like enzyme
LQHHKVFIARRNGQPIEVLCGSTNFTYRGLYIQANNALVFRSPEVAALFARVFERSFADPKTFKKDPLATAWHAIELPGKPKLKLCFSPHGNHGLSLTPVAAAIEQASSSVLYSVAFLNQVKSGPTKQAFDRLMTKPVFSYGISDKEGTLEVKKPDGSRGLVDFAFLSDKAPEPFKREWRGGPGINIHHKYVVTDFSLPSAKVFTGSSNLSPSGESKNGDHLLMIEDRKVAIAYAIEAVRIFDHLHFRVRMRESTAAAPRKKPKTGQPPPPKPRLSLRKPTAINGGEPAWFERYYEPGSQIERDRKLFSA